MKNINGVYQVEMLGAFGWERFATCFLQDGQFRGASVDHYTLGTYDVDGENFTMSAHLSQSGDQRAMFGLKGAKDLQIDFEGSIKGNRIAGKVTPKEKSKFGVQFRFTRLSDI